MTIDVDGSVVSTGLQVAWAQRGFNPHRRKVPSYYPITAYEAQSGQILRVQNRPGNIHDGKAALPFLRALLHQLRATLGSTRPLEFRMDGAFSAVRFSPCSGGLEPAASGGGEGGVASRRVAAARRLHRDQPASPS